MTRAPVVRAVAALAVIATSLFIASTMSPRLGLDLRGGTQIVLETKDSPTAKADAEATDRTLEVLRRRADALGVADAPLACYGLVSYAALVALDATLTLPGLAGFVLAIGMAVDANVLVFERAREEYAAVPKLRPALEQGFRNAWSAVADSNITTLLAAGLLFLLASGPVRGFGVTLSIGVIASLFTAMVVTRVLAQWAVALPAVAGRPRITGLAAGGRVRAWLTSHRPDLMKRRTACLTAASVRVGRRALTGRRPLLRQAHDVGGAASVLGPISLFPEGGCTRDKRLRDDFQDHRC